MTSNLTIRISKTDAERMGQAAVRQMLTDVGLDVRTVFCTERGTDLVYEGSPCPPNRCSVSEDGSSATTMSQGRELAPAASAGGNSDGGLTGDNRAEEAR